MTGRLYRFGMIYVWDRWLAEYFRGRLRVEYEATGTVRYRPRPPLAWFEEQRQGAVGATLRGPRLPHVLRPSHSSVLGVALGERCRIRPQSCEDAANKAS